MQNPKFVALLGLSAVFSSSACDDGGDTGDAVANSESDSEAGDTEAGDTEAGDTEAGDTESEGETGTPEDPDTDEDGLTDLEEAELGTDPTKKDTDSDNYWDSWELLEGTDPLDIESRIYQGWWPYSPSKDQLPQGSWASSTTETGSPFPRAEFVDQHGDLVDIYDFNNFTHNPTGEPAYMLIDMSAQWCGPCHNMAAISGTDSAETASTQQLYPTVRQKVEDLRVWWITIIVEDVNGGPPTSSDAESWYGIHQDNHVPILIDAGQDVRAKYSGGQYPFFFLLEPNMAIEYWGLPEAGDNPFLALFYVDQYL